MTIRDALKSVKTRSLRSAGQRIAFYVVTGAITCLPHRIQGQPTQYAFTSIAGEVHRGSEDGIGIVARFNSPWGVAVDSASNVYVGDTGNHTIRKISSNGIVSTFAGQTGSTGSTDGTGSAARFSSEASFTLNLAADRSNNSYVADTGNHTIRRISPNGVVTTLAGLAGTAGSADGPTVAARFQFPSGVAVDSLGNVYVADYQNHTIRKITPSGTVSTLAGLAGSRGSADGPGSAARFSFPVGVAYSGRIRTAIPI